MVAPAAKLVPLSISKLLRSKLRSAIVVLPLPTPAPTNSLSLTDVATVFASLPLPFLTKNPIKGMIPSKGNHHNHFALGACIAASGVLRFTSGA